MVFFTGYLALGSALSLNNALTELPFSNGYGRQAVTLTYDNAGGVISIGAAVTAAAGVGAILTGGGAGTGYILASADF